MVLDRFCEEREDNLVLIDLVKRETSVILV
jgi:hypothetical protein